MKPNWFTDRLSGNLRWALTGTYFTRKEQEEFNGSHGASIIFDVDKKTGGTLYLFEKDGSGPIGWTAHGWCNECDQLLAQEREKWADNKVQEVDSR